MNEISTRIDAGQAIVMIDARDAGDLLSVEGISALAAAIATAGSDAGVKLVRLQSPGTAFCAGRKPGGPKPSSQSAVEYRRTVANPILSVYRAIHESQVPVLAEVGGDAIGFGCAAVAACDLAVASSQAVFALPEMEKNLPPTLVLSVFRSRVALKTALHLTYLGTRFSAQDARQFGIVGEVVEPGAVRARCDVIAQWLLSRDRNALETLKAYQREAMVRDFYPSAEMAGSLLAVSMTSQIPADGR